jgi:alkylation response protein AidB-like acyl-CoA dehydrogenase
MQAEEDALTVMYLPTPPLDLARDLESPQVKLIELLDRAASVAKFCSANAANIDRNGAFPVKEFELIIEAGLLTAPLDRQFGGLGLGIDTSCIPELLTILQQIGRGNLAVGRIYEGHVNALQLLQTFGTPDQIAAYTADVRDRHKIFGVWNAEESDGVKMMPLGHGKYRLEGAKTFATGCGCVERPFIGAALPNGAWQLCIINMDEVATAIDADWWQPAGMRATASYKVDFTGVILDERALIGRPGDYYRQPWLTAGVVRFAAVQLGGAEALFDATHQFLHSLDRTQDPYQEQRLGTMAIGLESGRLWLAGAAAQLERYDSKFGGDPAIANPNVNALVAYTNMVRSAIEQICMEAIQLAQRSVGTRGLLPPHSIERIVRDLTLYLRQPAFDAAIANVGRYALQHSSDSLWKHESAPRTT